MVIKNNKQEELPKKRWLDEKEKEGIVFLRRVKRGEGGVIPQCTLWKQLGVLNLKVLLVLKAQIPLTEPCIMILAMMSWMLKLYGVCIWLMHTVPTIPIVHMIQYQTYSKVSSRSAL